MRSQMSSKETIRTVCKCWMQRAREPRNPSGLESDPYRREPAPPRIPAAEYRGATAVRQWKAAG